MELEELREALKQARHSKKKRRAKKEIEIRESLENPMETTEPVEEEKWWKESDE